MANVFVPHHIKLHVMLSPATGGLVIFWRPTSRILFDQSMWAFIYTYYIDIILYFMYFCFLTYSVLPWVHKGQIFTFRTISGRKCNRSLFFSSTGQRPEELIMWWWTARRPSVNFWVVGAITRTKFNGSFWNFGTTGCFIISVTISPLYLFQIPNVLLN